MMLKKYFLFFLCIFLLACKNKNSTLSIRVANYTRSSKHVTLMISPLIKVDDHIKVLQEIPSWRDLGNFNMPKGKHIYSLKCEGLSKVIVDSFFLDDDSYFTVTLRNDLNNYSIKDSLNISIIEKRRLKSLF